MKTYTKCYDCKAVRILKDKLVNSNPPKKHECPKCGSKNTLIKFK